MPVSADDSTSYEQIAHEHERLHELLAMMRQVFKEIHAAADRLPQYLAALREELEEHFTLEERDGYFREVADIQPQLSEQIDALKSQHQEFRERIGALERLAEAASRPDQGWRAVESGFHELFKELLKHEAAENQLIQEAYSRDIGSKD